MYAIIKGILIFIIIMIVAYYAIVAGFGKLIKDSYGRGVGSPMICAGDKVNDAGLCYDKPRDDYNCVATSCAKKCPDGWGGVESVAHCAKPSYDRGAGTIPDSCPEGQEKNGALCYPKCNQGYTGVGPVCWENCPDGYTDTGAFCTRAADTIIQDRYQRNAAGRIPDYANCPADYLQTALLCTKCETKDKGYYNYTWGCGTSIAPCWDGGVGCRNDCYRTWITKPDTSCDTFPRKAQCAGDEELIDGLCYKKCNNGYSSSRGDILFCTKDGCPNGYKDTGLTCYREPNTIAKDSYGRGAGSPMNCANDKVNDAGLCYTKCNQGYNGVGPICWKVCPDGYNDIGVSCVKPTYDRGVGTIPDSCSEGQVADAGLCYTECNKGYTGIGPVCWEDFTALE